VQGGIAQTIGLVLAFNGYRRRSAPSGWWPDGSIFAFCGSIDFVGRQHAYGSADIPVADPAVWLSTAPPSATGARLRVLARNDPNISDRESVGFAGGGPVFVAEMVGAEPSEAWWGEWRVGEQDAPDRRIWSVTYRNIASQLRPDVTKPAQAAEGKSELRSALAEVIAFSVAQNMGFTENFEAALGQLETDNPTAQLYYADMIPPGIMDLPYLQIFGCCATAWVFGGMGSWNDVWFDSPEVRGRYTEVSDRLFAAIIGGLTIATNSTTK
jgi:hypothetical protein